MGSINIANSNNRDAMVNTEAVRTPLRVRWLDEKGRQAQNMRFLRCTVDRDCSELVKQAGALEKVAELLVKGDPEIDFENYGRSLSDTSRVYIDTDKKIVHKVQEFEIVRNIDGSVRERRPRTAALPNVATETPLRWSGKLMKKTDVFNKFVFAAKLQIVHVNGLTYDFLYAMAKDLEEKQSLMLVGAGPKSNLPLIFHRGSAPYRGFLEGRTDGNKYCLVLHLSNMELKAPEVTASSASTDVAKSAVPPPPENKPAEEKLPPAAEAPPPPKAAAKKLAPKSTADDGSKEEPKGSKAADDKPKKSAKKPGGKKA
jgi:hypothetical protein